MDAKEISEKHAKAEAARKGWASDMVSRVVAAGQSIVSARANVKTASAPARTTPFSSRQTEVGARLDSGAATSGPRDLHSITAQDKDRQVNNAVAKAHRLVAQKLGKLSISSPNINYLKADISRWDDHTGQPQTGRISFQIPFKGPHGDPRTIYASVDLVMGDLMEPKTFTDGLNNVFAFDSSGMKEMFKGQEFDVVHQPRVVPEIKYTGPDFHAPDGQNGAVAAVDSPLIFRKASGEIVRQASGVKPRVAREGLIRPLSKEAFDIAQPITTEQAKAPKGAPVKREPSSAIPKYPGGSESNTPYIGESQNSGGGQTPAASTLASVKAMAELRELNWDGSVRATAKHHDVKALLDLAHTVTYGGHDYVIEVWNDGNLVERIANIVKRPNGGLRLATAKRLVAAAQENKKPPFDLTGAIIAFESGELDDDATLELFQHLVDTGMAWSLQGSYGRVAASLLEQGLIQPAEKDMKDFYGNTVPGKKRSTAPVEEAPHDSPSLEDEGKDLGSYESGARGSVRTASGLSEVITDLKSLDVRMVSFRDLALLCKQHGSETSISFDSASTELAKNGIILFKTASAQADNALARRVAHEHHMRLAAPAAEAPGAEMPAALPNQPAPGDDPAPVESGTAGMGEGNAQIAPPAGLDPVEFREFQALLDQYNNEWETVHQREMNNIKNGNPPHMGIDYTNLQLIYDKVGAFQQKSKQGKSEEMAATPSDLAGADKVIPPAANPGVQGPSPAQQDTGSTLMPEKGKGLAGVAPRMTRAALAQAMDMKDQSLTITDGVETVAAHTTNIDAATGGGSSIPKSAAFDLDDDAKVQMVNMGKDPGNPDDVKQFMGTFKKVSSHSQKFPEVCKNCKELVVPNGYSVLCEFKHTRLPFCGAAKKESVGFLHAYFRDCVGYDPIIKDIAQKVESKAPESQQKPGEGEKHYKTAAKKDEHLDSEGPFGHDEEDKGVPTNPLDVPIQSAEGVEVNEQLHGSADAEKVGELIYDLGGFLEGFDVDESDEGKRHAELNALHEKASDGGAVEAAEFLSEMNFFLELFEGEEEQAYRQRIDEALTALENRPFDPVKVESRIVRIDDKTASAVCPRCKKGNHERCLSRANPETKPICTCECKGWACPKCGSGKKNCKRCKGTNKYRTAAALPSVDPKAVSEKDSQTGAGLDIRKWCEQGGHYAPAGEVHPTHDWCTLWNTAVDNRVKMPSGAVIPLSMSGQSSETHGEGGPHQFGNTPNQTIR